ncbi:hypothetical protein HX798_26800 [Pseudomonas putida]|uniref:Uncharacterized protein n=1 Tax=Pseudomonas putida TaxID=303 RepID=A0A7Y8D3M2_PSEPU|nr:hypothetical protein [Pseudomonas putida]NWC83867.1 hypothetical protein [Pseudomonas putida]
MRNRDEQMTSYFKDDEKSKIILHILETDWPTAMQVVPRALQYMRTGETVAYGEKVLRASLAAYNAALGLPDQTRLKAFLEPLIEGLSALILASPPEGEAVEMIFDSLSGRSTETQQFAVRQKIEDLLLPEDTSIGRVWKSIKSRGV